MSEKMETDALVDALESIAHFAPGRAGVIARDTLVQVGVWSGRVESEERPHPTDYWLQRTTASTPGHDFPCPQGLAWSLSTGIVAVVA